MKITAIGADISKNDVSCSTTLVENIEKLSSQQFKELNVNDYSLITLDCGDKFRICVSEEIKENAKKYTEVASETNINNQSRYIASINIRGGGIFSHTPPKYDKLL